MIEYAYKAIYNKRDQLKIILWTGIIVAAFLNIFQPFGINNGGFCLRGIIMVSGYGLVASLGLLILILAGPIFKKLYSIHPWMFFGGSIFLISTLAYSYFMITFSGNGAHESFTQILLNTMVVGFVILLLVKGVIISPPQRIDNRFSTIIKIPSRNKSSSGIQLPESKVVLVEANGNYVSVYYLHDKAVRKKLIRNTMKNIETLVSHNENLVRCHTSFIVNTDYVLEKTRHNKRHFISLRFIEAKVPISDSYYPRINSLIG